MKFATQAVREILQESTEVRALPKLRAEWEHNRYSPIRPIDVDGKVLVNSSPVNDPLDDEWNSVFDVNSITLPNRPSTGIAKARLTEPIKLSSGYRDKPQQSRFYAAAVDDIYKYWSSEQRSLSTPVATDDYEFSNQITLAIMYEAPVVSNKIVVGFETSYARPKSYDIQITTVETPAQGDWKTVASNVIPDATTGQVVLWKKSDGSDNWSNIPDYGAMTWVHGVRLLVRSMNEAGAHLDVIQLGARLEHDLSDLVIDYGREFEVSERSFIAPLGVASSNQGAITLSNFDMRFNNTNEDSIYYGLIDKKVKLTMELSIDARSGGGAADERLREFTMWADSWGGQDDDSVSITVKDSSLFLQEVNMPKVFWENLTVGAIIWEIMDTVGMTNYNYVKDVLDTGQVIPYFWADEGTAWEVISQLAEATQTAVYFDEYDVMQIKTRKSIFGSNRDVDWNLDAVQNAQKLPDVVSVSTDDSMVVNQVEINYKPAEFRENKGIPVMETVWEPEDESVTLRATSLLKDVLKTSPDIWIGTKDATHWPYESYVNIRGEILKYRGKEYVWNKPGGGTEKKVVFNLEEKNALDEQSNPNLVWANSWSGRLPIVERGVSGSGTADHRIKGASYTGLVTITNGSDLYNWNGGHYQKDGYVQISTPLNQDTKYVYVMRPDATIPVANTNFGCRIRFPSAQLKPNKWAAGGIQFGGDWGDVGQYLELSPTQTIDDIDKRSRHEISLLAGGTGSNPLTRTFKGVEANIIYDKWYDLECRYKPLTNGTAAMTVFLDGVDVASWVVPANRRWPTLEKGNFGLFARGVCKVDFEYLYCVYDEGAPTPDASSYLDLTTGGFTSGYIEREWRFGTYIQKGRGALREGGRYFTNVSSRANYFYDEFGPMVHEMREFKVDFDEDDVPVAHSYPFISNTQVVCTDYVSNAFGARFTLVNASRRDAIVKGEDSITLESEDEKIDQKFFVYGRKLFQDNENSITKKNEQSIRTKGVVSLGFDNDYIQTEQAATDLANWVVDLWAHGADEVSAEVFGNPLLQLGDLVTLNYPVKGMTPSTHRYYIVSINNQFNQGLTTKLILRRART